jgi:hypothetical protein
MCNLLSIVMSRTQWLNTSHTLHICWDTAAFFLDNGISMVFL